MMLLDFNSRGCAEYDFLADLHTLCWHTMLAIAIHQISLFEQIAEFEREIR